MKPPSEWTDEEFLGYCEIHCRTERALFHRDHVARLIGLAGTADAARNIPLEWVVMREDFADPLIEKAREHLKKKEPSVNEKDPINPQHYRSHPSGVEAIDICEHLSFCLGNALKYVWRAGMKGDRTEDLKKALWYLEREKRRFNLVDETSVLLPAAARLFTRKVLEVEGRASLLGQFLAQFDALSDSRFSNPYINEVVCQLLINVLRVELRLPIPPESPEERPYRRRRSRFKTALSLIAESIASDAPLSPEWRERAEAFLKEDSAVATEEEPNG